MDIIEIGVGTAVRCWYRWLFLYQILPPCTPLPAPLYCQLSPNCQPVDNSEINDPCECCQPCQRHPRIKQHCLSEFGLQCGLHRTVASEDKCTSFLMDSNASGLCIVERYSQAQRSPQTVTADILTESLSFVTRQ
jgi:hypothetical protein